MQATDRPQEDQNPDPHELEAEEDSRYAAALARIVKREAELTERRELGAWRLENHTSQVVDIDVAMGPSEYTAVALSLTEQVQNHPVERVQGCRGPRPVWGILETPDGDLTYPLGVTLHAMPGEITSFECILSLIHESQGGFSEGNMLRLSVRSEDVQHARAWTRAVRDDASRHHDPLRGKIVELYFAGGDLYPRIIPAPQQDPGEVVVDPSILAEIDRNVTGHLDAKDLLEQAGLGSNRGVLLYGPPGTGKTSLVRDIINATNGKATVLVPSSAVVADALAHVYRDAVRLAPSVVILEDVDVVAGRRGRGHSDLSGFLSALDGVVQDSGALIITVATTNDPEGIDEAAKRPGRIDKFIEVPLPDELRRRGILERYLTRLAEEGIANTVHPTTVAALARASQGASGALLREVIRRALLLSHRENHGTCITEEHLADAAKEIGYRVTPATGQYL
jgi:Cdc6-like AAA superfamily ATPase